MLQGYTNFAFMFRHNGSKEVNFAEALSSPELGSSGGSQKSGRFEMSNYFNFGEHQDEAEQSSHIECYLLAIKYFHTDADIFAERFKQFYWITYCRRFKPLLVEYRSHQGKEVKNLTSDNSWGCTIRCLQMLVANALRVSRLPICESEELT